MAKILKSLRSIGAGVLCILLVFSFSLTCFASPGNGFTTMYWGNFSRSGVLRLAKAVQAQHTLASFDEAIYAQVYSPSYLFSFSPIFLLRATPTNDSSKICYFVVFMSRTDLASESPYFYDNITDLLATVPASVNQTLYLTGFVRYFITGYYFQQGLADFDGGYRVVYRQADNVNNVPCYVDGYNCSILYYFGGYSTGSVNGPYPAASAADDALYGPSANQGTLNNWINALDSFNGRTYDVGYNTGNATGYRNGVETGYAQGYETGLADGFESGYAEGIESGYDVGYESGAAAGYETGYSDGRVQGRAEAETVEVDVEGIISSIPQAVKNLIFFGDPNDPDYKPLELFGIPITGLLMAVLAAAVVYIIVKKVKP